jgi:hypothetical protein
MPLRARVASPFSSRVSQISASAATEGGPVSVGVCASRRTEEPAVKKRWRCFTGRAPDFEQPRPGLERGKSHSYQEALAVAEIRREELDTVIIDRSDKGSGYLLSTLGRS